MGCLLPVFLKSLLLPPSAAGEKRKSGDYLSPGQGSPLPVPRTGFPITCPPDRVPRQGTAVPCYLSPRQGSPAFLYLHWCLGVLYQGQAGTIGITDGVERLEKAQGLLEVEVGASQVCCAVVRS